METTMYDNLLQLPLFQGMSKDEFTSIIERVKLHFVTIKAGETIAKQGQPGNQLIYLLSGEIIAHTKDENNLYAISETFGETQNTRAVTVEKRNTTVKFRLSESELSMIQEKMKEYGTDNMSAYLRKMAVDGYVVKIELPELKEMIRLLSNYSNNINQIAKRVNASGTIYAEDFNEIRQSQERIWQAAEQIIRSLAMVK